jgi:hypothetical protein
VFTWYQTEVGHQLARVIKPPQVTDFCDEADCDALGNAPQSLKRLHQWRQAPFWHQLTDLVIDLCPPRHCLIHSVQVILQRVLLGGVVKRLIRKPSTVHLSPAFAGRGEVSPILKQVALNVLPISPNVKNRRLPRPNQVADRFVRFVGNPDRCQLTGAQQPGELRCVSVIILDPLARFARYSGWGGYFARFASLRQMPQYAIATRASFVHEFDSCIFSAQRVQQSINRLGAVWDIPKEAYIALAAGVRNGNRDRVLVNVKSNVCIEVVHDRPPPFETLVLAAEPIRCSVTYCRRTSIAEDGHTIYDIHVALSSPIALEALERIGRLYKIEEEIRARQPPERHAVRQARAGPELKSCTNGCTRQRPRCRRRANSPRRPAMRSRTGSRSLAIARTDDLRSTTMPRSGRYGPSPWGARTGSLQDPTTAGSVPRQSIRSWAPRNSTI